jgi:hypothetical protein
METVSHEAAQLAQVLRPLLALALITFIFVATGALGRVGRAGLDVACSDHRSVLLAVAVLLPRFSLVLVLVLGLWSRLNQCLFFVVDRCL